MFALIGFLAFPVVCIAQVVPTAPGPGETVMVGSQCTIEWHPDTTGTWKSLAIDLMSGSNNNMSHVTAVASGLDGTSTSSYSWTCPEVHPYAAIYFYQFNQKNATTDADHAWTTRFTIASAKGATSSPEHLKQPNGDPIPWGIGRLISTDEEQAKALTKADDSLTFPTTIMGKSHAASRHSRTMEPEKTDSPSPEVTLNVPAPKSTGSARRDVLLSVNVGGSQVSDLRRQIRRSLPSGARHSLRNPRRLSH